MENGIAYLIRITLGEKFTIQWKAIILLVMVSYQNPGNLKNLLQEWKQTTFQDQLSSKLKLSLFGDTSVNQNCVEAISTYSEDGRGAGVRSVELQTIVCVVDVVIPRESLRWRTCWYQRQCATALVTAALCPASSCCASSFPYYGRLS